MKTYRLIHNESLSPRRPFHWFPHCTKSAFASVDFMRSLDVVAIIGLSKFATRAMTMRVTDASPGDRDALPRNPVQAPQG